MTELSKVDLLKAIAQASEKSFVSRKEVVEAYEKGKTKVIYGSQKSLRVLNITEVFSSIGCGIIFLGIAILISEHWGALSSFNKVILTLGSGVIAYVMGAIFDRDKRVWIISSSFFFLSALLIPFGIAVILQIKGYDPFSTGFSTVVSGLSLVIFLLSLFLIRNELFLFFCILYGAAFFYSVMNFFYAGFIADFNIYCTIVVSFSYLLLGYYFDKQNRHTLTGFLYGFGCLGLLGSLFVLGVLHKGSVYEWTFPLVLALVIYASVQIRSTAFLTFGVIFIILWIIEITDRYFSESLGWPIALVLAGFLLIGMGYAFLRIRKTYFK